MTKMLSGLSKQKGRLGHSPGALELGALGPLPSSTRRSWIPFGATSHVQKVAILRRGIWVVFALALMALTAQSRLSVSISDHWVDRADQRSLRRLRALRLPRLIPPLAPLPIL